ncbi:MAG TPA: hypothetical protein VGK31_15360 [Thermoanaerobaculia bacterium]
MNVDYNALEEKILDGSFRTELEDELLVGFRSMRMAGDHLPLPSYYASQIAEIVARGAPAPLRPELAYEVYQEILAACEHARATVLAEA